MKILKKLDNLELDKIKRWNVKDSFGLIDYIEGKWFFDNAFRMKWKKDKFSENILLFLELHTFGWSENEEIINALLDNESFCSMWYAKWKRGGHYYFEINPSDIGFKKVLEIANERGVSRQMIHRTKEDYEWIVTGKRNMMCRIKEKSNQ